MIRRPYRHQRARSQFSPNQAPPPPSIAAAFSLVANKCRLTFPGAVVVSSLPVGITRQAAGAVPQLLPTAFTIIDAQTVDLTYAANVVATDVVTIPANVQQIRSTAGGYPAAAVHTF